MVAAQVSSSRVACGTGAAAARGGAGEARREAYLSIPMLPRRSTLSASSAVLPAAQASSYQQVFLISLSRNATGLDQDDAAGLDAFDCYRRMHPPDAAIRAVRLFPRLEAAQHVLKRQSLPFSRLLCLPLTGTRLCRKAAPESPAVGPLSSESTLPCDAAAVTGLLHRLTPARTVPCVSAAQPHLFDTIFKSTTVMEHSHRLWSWPARDLPLNRPTTRPCS